eukprot:7498986-Karenia_brevis.AAC.1
MGRGRRTPHVRARRTQEEQEARVPKIVFDYHFMSEDDRHAGRNPMLGMRDLKSGGRWMRATGQKGLGGG